MCHCSSLIVRSNDIEHQSKSSMHLYNQNFVTRLSISVKSKLLLLHNAFDALHHLFDWHTEWNTILLCE